MKTINKEKLEGLIAKELMDISHSSFVESRFCIGEIKGKQIIVVVTEDEDTMFDEISEDHLCLEEVSE